MDINLIVKEVKEARDRECKRIGAVFSEWFGAEDVELDPDYRWIQGEDHSYSEVFRFINSDIILFNNMNIYRDPSYIINNLDRYFRYVENRSSSRIEHAAANFGMLEWMTRTALMLKPFAITVRFPHIVIENENGNTHDIYDLFMRVRINAYGLIFGDLQMARQTFSRDEIISGYLHSHYPSFKNQDSIVQFLNPCLGRGPIVGTLKTLKKVSSRFAWELMCCELGKYVRVESLSGGPYIRMSAISSNGGSREKEWNFGCGPVSLPYYKPAKQYAAWLLSKNLLKFRYVGGRIDFTLNDYELEILFTKHFKEFWKDTYQKESPGSSGAFIERVVDTGNSFLNNTSSSGKNVPSTFNGAPLFKFKGEDLKLRVLNMGTTIRKVKVLNRQMCSKMASDICFTINYYYGKKKETSNRKEDKSSSGLYVTNRYGKENRVYPKTRSTIIV